jgi:phytoene dehydrogenase-like protein
MRIWAGAAGVSTKDRDLPVDSFHPTPGDSGPLVDTNYFDVVVYGSELAGLIAASLLGRRGLRVLLCGHDSVPATFQAGPYTLARESGTLPPPDSEPVARVLRELGHAQIIRRRAQQAQPSLQFVFPQHRVEFSSTLEAVVAELTREFPGDHATIEPILGRLRSTSAILDPLLGSDMTLPPQGFWERRDVSRVQAQLPPADTDLLAPLGPYHPMRAGIAALGALASGFSPADLGSLVQARAYDVARRGFHRLASEADLRSLFLDKLGTFSGEIREHVVPTELVWRRGNLNGLRVRPRNETIGFGRLIWAASAASLLALAGSEAPRRLRETASSIRPACFRYTLCLLLRPEGLPEGMGPRVVAVKDPAKPNLEENAFSITVGLPPPRQPSQIPVWIECLVSASASESLGYLSVVRARLREDLMRIMPFYDRHLHVIASPHDGLPPELGPAVRGDATQRGRLPGVPPTAMTPALSCDVERVLGLGGASHSTGLKNVYLASGENLPGLGREGHFVSAWGVARQIAEPPQHKSGRKREILIEDI